MAFPDLYKRSIYFEIYSVSENGEPNTLLESYAFSMPPSAIDITELQRITKTPTPGGWFIDNYGHGGARISINGETGNEEDRLTILGPGRTPQTVTGQESYFEFRNRISRFSLKNENYIMRFYDLTHKGQVNLFRANTLNKVAKYSEAWEVTLDESGSQRTSAKPFFYPYRINLTGLRPLGTYNPRAAKNETAFLADVRESIDSTTDALAAFNANINQFLSNNFEYLNDITDILESANSFGEQLTTFTEQFLEYEQKLGGVFDEVLSQTEDAISTGIQIISFPYDVLITARDQLVALRTKTESLLLQTVANGQNVIDKYDWDEEVDPTSEISLSVTDIETTFNPIVIAGQQGAAYDPISAISFNGEVQLVYGYGEYIILGNTRLDRLANDIYGDPDFSVIISGLNDIYSNDELVPGETLLLPLLEPDIRFADNGVFSDPSEASDVLGRDILIDLGGVFLISNNDYLLTSGLDTIVQAVDFRLSELLGRQIRDNTYGIISQVGAALDNEASLEFVAISLEETLIQDPRIINVYGLNFIVDGDTVNQVFSFDTITRETSNIRRPI